MLAAFFILSSSLTSLIVEIETKNSLFYDDYSNQYLFTQQTFVHCISKDNFAQKQQKLPLTVI